MLYDRLFGQLLWIVALAACHSSKPPVEPAFTPAGPQACGQMADHLVGMLGGGEPETREKIRTGLATRCTDDKWTMDAQTCFQNLANIDGADACASKLTIDQRDGFQEAIETATR